MTGGKNILSYISQDKKTQYETILDYLEKSSKVFNQNGFISKDELEKMKERVSQNKGNIWHGFISLNEENSYKINTPEKSIGFVKEVFQTFFQSAKLNSKNIDLMCSLHTDRPHHLHIHFVFWEKEPMYKTKDGTLAYRKKGKIEKKALDMMFVKSGIFVSENKDRLYKSRNEAIKSLREMTTMQNKTTPKEIKKEIITLAKELPKTGRIAYGSQDMKPYLGRVNQIVRMLFDYNGELKIANQRFYEELENKKQIIQNIIKKDYAYVDKEKNENYIFEHLPKYHFQIEEKNINIIEEIEKDYQKRLGNIVIKLAKNIQQETLKDEQKRKANDTKLKKSIMISEKKVGTIFNQFFKTIIQEHQLLERDFSQRLQEIEDEIKKEHEKEREGGNYKS